MTREAELARAFRLEARELFEELARGLLELERHPERAEVIHRCFRLAHTLKGAARVVREPRIAELAHAVEDALAPHRAGAAAPDAEFMGDLLALVGALRREVAAVDAPRPEGGAGAPFAGEPGEERLETVRVEIAALDEALEAAAEAAVQIGAARRAAAALRDAGDALGAALEAAAREVEDLHRRLGALRLVPARTILPSLELAARDAAQALGKQVDVEASFEEVRLEGHILADVRAALLHLVRNAIAHGVEPAAERARLGKPAAGRVRLSAARRGRHAVFTCADDGRGMDLEALRAAALQRELISPEQAAALGREETLRLALRAGVSTSEGVTELSGRGVGLDVAAETAARYAGELRVNSEPGLGVTLELEVALSLSSVAALAVRAGEATALIPLHGVAGAVRLTDAEVLRGGHGDTILHEGREIPFAPLARVLGAASVAPRARWSAVVVRSGDGRAALGVDRLLGSTEVLVKPLPSAAGEHASVAGAALDAQGDPMLVLDPRGLLQAAVSLPNPGDAARPRPRLPILVIDDSLTTRMLERSILEAAGYAVDLAGSGEEGLRKAKERRYGLFVVDVEMPGMSGLEFIRAARADAALRGVPAIIVTSRGSAEDRRRGLDAGAAAYIVKGEFEQRRFVSEVGALMAAQA